MMKKYFIVVGVIVVIGVVAVLTMSRNDAPTPAVTGYSKQYVALGDSVAAGVGLKDYTDSSACNRTAQAYPNRLASLVRYGLQSYACSGATIASGIIGPQNVNQLLVKPQLTSLFANPKPNLISVTIGANDAHWTDVIQQCYVSVCGSSDDTAAVMADITQVQSNMATVMGQLKQQYGNAVPRVIVTGYHQVFPANVSSSCTDLSGIETGEMAWARQLQTSLNDSLSQTISSYDFATFVPIDFTGHELCTANPWVQGLSDTAPYHPNNSGQIQFAKQIRKAITQ